MTAIRGDILDIEDWAARAGYRLACKPYENLSPLPDISAIAPPFRIGLEKILKLRQRGLALVEGRNVDLISHVWFEPHRGPQNTISQVFFLQSEKGDFYFDDPAWLQGIEGISFLQRFGEGGRDCLFDFSGYDEGLHVKEPCAYLGSSNNWGHQISDILPNLLVLESMGFPKDGKLVTGVLSPMFLELYAAMGISQERLLIVDHAAKSHAVHRFDSLLVPSQPPHDVGNDFVRQRLERNRIKCDQDSEAPQRIYFSRRALENRGRIANQDEVEDFFLTRGFKIIDPMKLSVSQLQSLLSNVEMIAAQFGAALGNQILAPASSVMINLFPPLFFSDAVPRNVAAYWRSQNVPFLNRCVFALGEPESPVSGPDLLKAMDVPHRYDPRVLDQALMQAESLALRMKLSLKGENR